MVVAGLFIYLWGVVLSNTEMVRKRTNKCVLCLVTGRKKEKERKRKREIKKFWTRFTAKTKIYGILAQ